MATRSKPKIYDVIIVGAGASGLACAHELLKQGLEILVLEGRPRIGGRAFTVHRAEHQDPIELGAEFIHGRPKSTLNFLSAYNLSFYDVTEARFFLQNSRLKKLPDFFERIGKIMKRLSKNPEKDRSVEEFLKNQKSISLTWKKIFQGFVEGFHGADLSVMGENGLADTEESDDDELNGSSLFRPIYGYDKLLEGLSHLLIEKQVLRFHHIVNEIHWSPGSVQIKCRSHLGDHSEVFQARKILMTAPLGVLKANSSSEASIRWNPRPSNLELMEKAVEMGHVQKIVFHFRSRFWEGLTKDPMSFVHLGPEKDFPTWWNLLPLRSTQLVAWQGGPRALEMASWSQTQRVQAALTTLSEWSAKPMSALQNELHSFDTHNWSEDPFSQGAYSYVKQNGSSAAKSWFRPVKGTVFFAGEATCTGPGRGTLHGAFESGQRAAEQILKSHFKNTKTNSKGFQRPISVTLSGS